MLGARPARRAQRGRARPELTVLDVDATLTGSHSDKEGAAGNFKGGYGHHPLLCYEDGIGEAMAAELRAGNAGSNTARDHIAVLDRRSSSSTRKRSTARSSSAPTAPAPAMI